MKKQTDLHPAQRAMTTKEFDALWPKTSAPQGIRPLMPMVVCDECERLAEELRIMTADLSGSAARNMVLMAENRQLENENEALQNLLANTHNHMAYMASHSDWTPAEVKSWLAEIKQALGVND